MGDTIDIFALIPAYLQAIALIAGGVWAYIKFIYQREKEPASNIDIDVEFVGTQDNKWVIEITSYVENKSLVRLTYKKDFQVTIRYLEHGDNVEDGSEKIHYQLNCPKTINQRIDGEVRTFANAKYVNPKQEFKHRYITYIPIEASFIWIQCKFEFDNDEKEIPMNSQKIFKVPAI